MASKKKKIEIWKDTSDEARERIIKAANLKWGKANWSPFRQEGDWYLHVKDPEGREMFWVPVDRDPGFGDTGLDFVVPRTQPGRIIDLRSMLEP